MFKKGLVVFLIILLAIGLLVGCSASNSKGESESKSKVNMKYSDAIGDNAAGDRANTANYGDSSVAVNKDQAISGNAEDSSAQSAYNAILAQRKVIQNANVTLEVENFDQAYSRLLTLISAFGFVQENNIEKEKVMVGGKEKLITSGLVIIRVAQDHFMSTLTDIKGLGLLLNQSIKSEDVTDKFFDTESRLRLLRFEEGRLEDYLKKQTDPDIIFKTETRLTDIRHEIESLTGTLNKWTDLVELSTITINMKEINPVAEAKEAESFGSKLVSGFTDSLKAVVSVCGEILLFLVQAIPVLLFLGIIGFLAVLTYRKLIKPRQKTSLKEKDLEE